MLHVNILNFCSFMDIQYAHRRPHNCNIADVCWLWLLPVLPLLHSLLILYSQCISSTYTSVCYNFFSSTSTPSPLLLFFFLLMYLSVCGSTALCLFGLCCFFSFFYTVARTLWTGDQPTVRSLLTH
jgi:hypothetical protein